MTQRKELLILGIGAVILSIYIYSKDPALGPILPCIFNKITGLYCPGCGMTRAVSSCLKFEFHQAFRYNILLFFAPFILSLYWLAKYKNKKKLSNIILILAVIISIMYGILRNTSRFSYLSPSILIRN